MKKEDLIEFLLSTIEEDAIISRIYNLFHVEKGYSIEELNLLAQYGIDNSYFILIDVLKGVRLYTEIDWKLDNITQEIIMKNMDKFKPYLFTRNPCVPKEFIHFLDV